MAKLKMHKQGTVNFFDTSEFIKKEVEPLKNIPLQMRTDLTRKDAVGTEFFMLDLRDSESNRYSVDKELFKKLGLFDFVGDHPTLPKLIQWYRVYNYKIAFSVHDDNVEAFLKAYEERVEELEKFEAKEKILEGIK